MFPGVRAEDKPWEEDERDASGLENGPRKAAALSVTGRMETRTGGDC